jgi:hypothetical protein
MRIAVFVIIFFSLVAGLAQAAPNSSVPAAPVPKSPYLPLIYRYADTLLEHGRDTNGMFLNALDRSTFKPVQNTNAYDHQNLLRLLYTLSELSTKPKYRDAADAALRAFLKSDPAKHFRTWMLWNRCFEIAPEQSTQLALHLVEPGLHNVPFCLRAWSTAYARTTNQIFLNAVDKLVSSFGPSLGLSLAIDCDGSAQLLPEPLASRLRAIASREDDAFCKIGGEILNQPWDRTSAAQPGMMCVSRYENTGRPEYRDSIHRTANAYLKSSPPENQELWPVTLGQAISLQLAAWRSSARPEHLEKAREFADFAIAKFFGDSALPRSTLKTDRYEAFTGADTLALAMTELHLHVLYITAVRWPPNTIDR